MSVMPGFRVLAVSEYAGELEQAVETAAEDGWCPALGHGDPPGGGVDRTCRREACRRVGEDGHTVAAVAAEFGVGWAIQTKLHRWATDGPGRRFADPFSLVADPGVPCGCVGPGAGQSGSTVG